MEIKYEGQMYDVRRIYKGLKGKRSLRKSYINREAVNRK